MNQGLGGSGESSSADGASESAEQKIPGPQGQAARRVLARLKVDAATQLDTLVEAEEEISPSEIIAALFELEMLGLVRQQPGRNFVKVW
jgi:DNA processing protein